MESAGTFCRYEILPPLYILLIVCAVCGVFGRGKYHAREQLANELVFAADQNIKQVVTKGVLILVQIALRLVADVTSVVPDNKVGLGQARLLIVWVLLMVGVDLFEEGEVRGLGELALLIQEG